MSSQVAEPFTSVDIPAKALQDFESFAEGLPAAQRQQDLPVWQAMVTLQSVPSMTRTHYCFRCAAAPCSV